jgi:pimeloyl-ACP methyl ester carboxylesterase
MVLLMRAQLQRNFERWRREFTGDISVSGVHPIDVCVALLTSRSKMFSRGWGDEALLAGLSNKVSNKDNLSSVALKWAETREENGIVRRDGTFVSPLEQLPSATATVHVRSQLRKGNQAACVFLAASRDEGYRAREFVFGSLVERGIDLFFLENPFYGRRRTLEGPSLISVSDQALMALGMVMEARALLASVRCDYAKVAVAGYSMGGHMAAITAAVTPFPVGCAALATGASASSIYLRGLLAWSVDFEGLRGDGEQDIAQERLRLFFDAADITHYDAPLRTDAAVLLGCTRDGYVQRSETERLHRHWRESDLRWLRAGHFSALLTDRRALCNCVADAITRL